MTRRQKLKQLVFRLERGERKIKRIRVFNTRRRRAIRRLRAELGTRVMFDSVDVAQIPGKAGAVAGYTGGQWPTYWDLVKRYPHAFVLAIAIAASEDAHCLDVEAGDAHAEEVPAWVRRQHARGVKRPVVYCSVSEAERIISLLAAAGVPRREFLLWTAHWTFEAHLCGPHSCGALDSTADATQWTDQALGRNLDESRVSAAFVGS
jgi:hypothetical protein